MPNRLTHAALATLVAIVATPSAGAQTTASAPVGAASADSTRPMTLSGTVYDSVARAPLADAYVQLVDQARPDRSRTVATDSLGRYRIERVLPGHYLLGFMHPTLDLLGLAPPTLALDIRPDTAARLDLAIPSPARVRTALCGAAVAGDSTGVLFGAVRDAESDAPIEGATVELRWSEIEIGRGVRTVDRRVPVTVREGGSYILCGVPNDADLRARATAPGRRGGEVEVQVPAGGMARRDFLLADSSAARVVAGSDSVPGARSLARGAATLAGTVRDARGRPVAHARIVVPGSDVSGETTDAGTFTLSGLPSGTYAVEARALGYVPKRTTADLSSRRPATVALVLDARATTLERVTVLGKPSARTRYLDEFVRRQHTGMGRFVTATDIERRHPNVMTDALRMIPGLRVVPGQFASNALRGRGDCTPSVYLDGMQVFAGADDIDMIVSPQEVAGVEVYTGIGTVPAQFSGLGANGCGVVAVWTKR